MLSIGRQRGTGGGIGQPGSHFLALYWDVKMDVKRVFGGSYRLKSSC